MMLIYPLTADMPEVVSVYRLNPTILLWRPEMRDSPKRKQTRISLNRARVRTAYPF